jgi:hypothetical protein
MEHILRAAVCSVIDGDGYNDLYTIYDTEDEEHSKDEIFDALTTLKAEVEAALKMLEQNKESY